MRNSLFVLIVLVSGCGGDGCRQDPPIIIRFEPAGDGDTPAQKPLDAGVAKPKADLAPVAAAKPATKCKKDSECVVENIDCCGCSANGKQRAVHKKDAEPKAQYDARCADFMCAEHVSDDGSCFLRAGCSEMTNYCVLMHDRRMTEAQGAPGRAPKPAPKK